MKMKLDLDELQVESFETVAGEAERGTVHGYITGTLGCNCTDDTCASCEGTCDTCADTCPNTCRNTCPATCATCPETCWQSCNFTDCAEECTYYHCWSRPYC